MSTCFVHQYAHHQENKTVYYRIWCSARVVLVVVGCGCVELRRELCALCEGYCSNSNLHTVHAAPHNHNQHNQCRTPYAVVHGLVLLMMGIMMPETCWDRSLIINIGFVASCWFLSLHPTFMMQGHKKPKIVRCVGYKLRSWLFGAKLMLSTFSCLISICLIDL